MDARRVAVVTGSSSGFGLGTVVGLARRGWLVCASMRDPAKGELLREKAGNDAGNVVLERIDVTDQGSIDEAVGRLLRTAGRIDLLVNCAGYGLIGALEDLDFPQIEAQMNTNFYGAVRMMRAVLPTFRKQRGGKIINVTSVAGLVGMPLYPAYCGSKFALEGLSEAMRFELRPYNIRICNVEPGPYSTNFSGEALVFGARTNTAASPYREINEYFAARTGNTHFHDPAEVVDAIVELAETDDPVFWNCHGSKVRPLVLTRRYLGVDLTQRVMTRLMKVPTRRQQ